LGLGEAAEEAAAEEETTMTAEAEAEAMAMMTASITSRGSALIPLAAEEVQYSTSRI
jgi:small ligand-binding sensory domain FIST